MAALYADEDFSLPVIWELRRLGHDVLTVREAGQANQKIDDPTVLACAIRVGRSVLTFNHAHFRRLHRQVQPHSGIISCTRDDDVVALAARIHEALSNCPDLVNQFIRIVRPNVS